MPPRARGPHTVRVDGTPEPLRLPHDVLILKEFAADNRPRLASCWPRRRLINRADRRTLTSTQAGELAGCLPRHAGRQALDSPRSNTSPSLGGRSNLCAPKTTSV